MVRSTHIARASDALPLAASVDDEEVSADEDTSNLALTIALLDRAGASGIQTTSQARMPKNNAPVRA